jgi:hypothetical protein
MILDAIFIHKEDNNDIELFKSCFKNLTFEGKELSFDGLNFEYCIQELERKKGIRLSVKTKEGKSTKKEADNLVALKNVIIRGEHRKNYHIIFIYDGASEYYCCKLGRLISIFERNLRKFIYLNIIDIYGKEWVHKTISEEIQQEVSKNERNKNRHIERALECFSFQNYVDYLFTERSVQNPYEVIKEALSAMERGEETQSHVINILKNGVKISLWDKFFREFGWDFSQNEINRIREIRNTIMHNKEITDTDFSDYKRVLRTSIKKLNQGIESVVASKYSSFVNIEDILYSLNETIKGIENPNEHIKKFLFSAMQEISKLNDRLKEIFRVSEAEKIRECIELGVAKSMKTFSVENYSKYQESIEKLQNSVKIPFLEDWKLKNNTWAINLPSNLNKELKTSETIEDKRGLLNENNFQDDGEED